MSQIKLLTNKEAADFLGLTPHTLDQWRWRQKGPDFVKKGRFIRYRESDLTAWIDSHTRQNAGLPLPA